jgi:hypothetical protein
MLHQARSKSKKSHPQEPAPERSNTSANEAVRTACADAIATIRQAQPKAVNPPLTPCIQP